MVRGRGRRIVKQQRQEAPTPSSAGMGLRQG